MIPQVEASLSDVASFKSIVSLLSFLPFKSGTNALDNCNSISEGNIFKLLCFFAYLLVILRSVVKYQRCLLHKGSPISC